MASRAEAPSESAAWMASASAAGSRGGTSHPVRASPSTCGGAAMISRAGPTSEMMVIAPIAAASIEVRVTPSASTAGKTTTAAPTNAAGGSATAPTRTSIGWTPHLRASASSSRANTVFADSPANTKRTSSRPWPLISAAASMSVWGPRPGASRAGMSTTRSCVATPQPARMSDTRRPLTRSG